MKSILAYLFVFFSITSIATPADSLKRRKHFAIEGDVAYASARINPVIPWSQNLTYATQKAPNFMVYNLAFVYSCRGIKRDCSDPVHDLSFVGGASFMKMNIEQTMQNYSTRGYDYVSDIYFGTQKINYTYNPVELCLLFRYTYSTRKFFASINAGVSRVLVDDSRYASIQYTKNTVTTNNNGTTNETINSTTNVDHYLVPNNSTNNILGLRFGYNGKRISPYITIQRHGATSYMYAKFGVGLICLL